ncbi:MAG: hypothetical protein C4547_14100 [Phycisphaerales bacterium]|nr:MAG: hypothetical protein C4547_14100 [Phycisphaerales bacterium]
MNTKHESDLVEAPEAVQADPQRPFVRVLFIAGGLAFLILQVMFFYGLAVAKQSRRPDVLLVTFDTLRADHCSACGYDRPTTRTLETLAAGGARFAVACAPMATTAPSHASMFTSRYPLSHGVLRNGFRLPDEAVTLAELLRDQGYSTAAFVSSFVLYHKFGLAQGFDVYDDDFSGAEGTQAQTGAWEGEAVPGRTVDRRADATTDAALKWLAAAAVEPEGRKRRPIFTWVHYMDPHEPYVPPESFGDPFGSARMTPGSLEQAIARYDTEIAFADAQLKRLVDAFDAAGRETEPLIIVTSDHGEAFCEHGWRGHGPQIYEEAVRIPLIVRWEGRIPPGRVIEAPVSLPDVAATVLDLIGVDAPRTDFDGESLAAALTKGVRLDDDRPHVFQRRLYERDGAVEPIPLREMDGATFGQSVEVRGVKFAIRSGRWKYYEAREERVARELYDLRADPGEQSNVAADHPDDVNRLSQMLNTWRRRQLAGLLQRPPQTVTSQDRAILESLGYTEPDDDDP